MAMPSISIDLEKGLRLVEKRAGILLEPHDLSAFATAVEQGMTRTAIAQPEEYFEYLEKGLSRSEFEHLLEQVVNNETYFFREPQHFEMLKKIGSAICAGDRDFRKDPVRILSAGCSTGEEPYSIAIELLELTHRFPGLNFEVVGTDISQAALDLARQAVFGGNSFRNPAAVARRNAWFKPVGDRCFKPIDRVRSKVEFRYLNLNSDPSLKDLPGEMDVIFFRNVLIYLSPAARLRVCRSLVSSLRPSGSLFTGISETLQEEAEGLISQQVDGVFFWQKGRKEERRSLPQEITPPSLQKEPFLPTAISPRPAGAAARQPEGPTHFQTHSHEEREQGEDGYVEALKMAREDRARDALELLDRIIRELPDHIDAHRLAAELHLDCAEFENALRFGNRALEIDADLAWPHVLQGRVFQYEGEMAKAQKELKTAIYYQPDCWPAHFYLAEAYRALGETSLALRAYRNALRNLDREKEDRPPDVDFIGYSKTDIALTCQMNIRSLTDSATPNHAE
jgi:chemotaxis protein methyltransferase CheR